MEDVLLMQNNPFIVQNYHTIEADLRLVSHPVQQIQGFDRPFTATGSRGQDKPQRNYTLTIIVSLFIISVLLAVGWIVYRRKLRSNRRKEALAEDSAFEMVDMLEESNRRTEMWS